MINVIKCMLGFHSWHYHVFHNPDTNQDQVARVCQRGRCSSQQLYIGAGSWLNSHADIMTKRGEKFLMLK